MCKADFKQLAETAEVQQTRESMDALWRAVFSLGTLKGSGTFSGRAGVTGFEQRAYGK
jgi:hypothetical protein